MRFLAHTKNKSGKEHDLKDHLEATAQIMEKSAPIEFKAIFKISGLIHDFGKYQPEFQKYLIYGGRRGSVPHAAWGAALAAKYKIAEAAFAIDGHHKGLPDRADLINSIGEFQEPSHEIHKYEEIFRQNSNFAEFDTLNLEQSIQSLSKKEILIRFLFSALTDADWLDTEKHFSGDKVRPDILLNPELLLSRLHKELLSKSKEGWLNKLRNEVRQFAVNRADDEIGFFSMTLPTGMGKTLASVNWALKHAQKNKLSRIIIVLPYISIIDQTAGELKRIFGEENVLEHHSGYLEKDENDKEITDEGIQDEAQMRRLATENWDFPIIVTTTVQFFESLFSNKPSKCRKVHNIAQSVVIFDEVQTLPKELILPVITMLKDVHKIMKTSFLFCTATLPAFAMREKFSGIDNIKPLVEKPAYVFSKTKRVTYIPVNNYEPTEYSHLFDLVTQKGKSTLCVFNTKQKARDFCSFLEGSKEYWWFHLSTYLCPAHRRKIIRIVKACLRDGRRILLSSTQLIEAGVDFDFPVVFREIAPLESIIQSAGRCNREGILDNGDVFIFRLSDNRSPDKQYIALGEYALGKYKGMEERLFDHDFFTEYYQEAIDLFCDPDRRRINEQRNKFNFKTVAGLFRLIDSKTTPIFIFKYNKQSESLFNEIKHKPFLSRSDYRAMQQYTVQVYDNFLQMNNHLIGKEKAGFLAWYGKYDSHYGVSAEVNNELDTLIL